MDMMYAWITKNIIPITSKIQKLEMLNLLEKDMQDSQTRNTTIEKTYQQMETMMFPVLDGKILGASKQFLCGKEMTPVDYILSEELNTVLILLDKEIDQDKFKNLSKWRK